MANKVMTTVFPHPTATTDLTPENWSGYNVFEVPKMAAGSSPPLRTNKNIHTHKFSFSLSSPKLQYSAHFPHVLRANP
jgi:hypothetical protein